MQRSLDSLIYSASDLNNFLACDHLLTLELRHARQEQARPAGDSEDQALMSRKGLEHEAAFLDRLKADGRTLVELRANWASPDDARHESLEAMRQGADTIYQATFWDGLWRGMADFLQRVDSPSDLGPWSYEVLDTKMARSPKAYYLLQLCFYSDLLTQMQGEAPERMHVALGNGETLSFRVSDFAAYYRHIKRQFLEWVADDTPQTQPYPVEHCGLCPWQGTCEEDWEARDHLSRVANIRHSQILKLEEAGIDTMAALAEAEPQQRPRGMSIATFETLRDQARLQCHHRETGTHKHALLPHEPGRGFALLPAPDAGDVFFDMEGDPYMAGGLEYLFGVVYQDGESWPFKAFWAHSRQAERRAFEAFVDFVMARRRQYPGMHVYHYAAYEETALKRLASQHGTREEEIDTLLREGVLVDLFRVVRQGLRVSQPSYSIKKLEAFYMEAREADVKNAGASIVAYENWIETGDDAILDDIGRYNEEDCVSTRLLRDWMLTLRTELEAGLGEPLPWPTPDESTLSDEAIAMIEHRNLLAERLCEGLPEDPETATPAERARQLLADLLDYHRREEKPLWWSFFHHCAMTGEELVTDGEAIGGLRPEGDGPVRPEKKSQVWRLRFEPQDHKLRVGMSPVDPDTRKPAGEILALDDEAGWLEIKRGPSLGGQPLPRGLFPFDRVPATVQPKALQRLAEAVVDGDIEGPGPYRALCDLLMGAHPRIHGRVAGEALQGATLELEEILAIATNLDESTLIIQGPPGAGKTFTGARMIVALLKLGKRIGIAATSHKAIHNLLAEVEVAAQAAGATFTGLKKCTAGNPETQFRSVTGMIESKDKGEFNDPAVQLIAGTAWLFAKPDLDDTLDYLVLDEAGQISLADALAMGTSARNLILLGDPQQLPHVAQGIHPRGSGCSVLTHLLSDADTIPPDRGLFLDRTWRMHPAITGFISGLSYENRLQATGGCELQHIDAPDLGPAGLRFYPVAHQGNAQASVEEAVAVEDIVSRLIGTTFTDKAGRARPMTEDDILVVAPYNVHVELLRGRLPQSIRVGTVDKFQGQEAPVVIFSMATSSGDEMPRNMEFLFNRNRLNVAISRAKCLAVLVASPALLDVRCKTVEQMRLVNALCRFVEVAREQSASG
jgi:uncharacterized protein